MCRPRTKRAARPIAAAAGVIGLGLWLAACSNPDLYLDHRETVGASSGDAIAANEATQMVDPWPPNSGNRNVPSNGEKMQTAIERYRTNRVIPPINPTTSEVEVPPGMAATTPPALASPGSPGPAGPPVSGTASAAQ